MFPRHFDFYPHTYVLPEEFPELSREHTFICGRTASNPIWVLKPKNGCCGRGVRFVQSLQDAESVTSADSYVAQLLVNPLLLQSKKFDFRFFLLISSLEPFSAFIYREGIARFCTQSYVTPTKLSLDRPFGLLTNTAINKMSEANPDEFTRPASEVLREVAACFPAAANVWDEICEVSLMTLVGIFPAILACLPHNGGAHVRSRLLEGSWPAITIPRADRGLMYLRNRNEYPFLGAVHRKKVIKKKKKGKAKKMKKLAKRPPEVGSAEPEAEAALEIDPVNPGERMLTQAQRYFQILGIDIILDSKGHPKLLELNDRPSLQITATFEKDLKEGMIAEAFTHLSLDGSSFGENEASRWQQILPVSPMSELANPIQAIMQQKSDLKWKKKTVRDSPVSQRMMEAGIKTETHEALRLRYFSPLRNLLPPMTNSAEDIW
jgi:hypothetical protein